MWFLRILTGTQSGQIFFLKKGTNTIGRFESCHIKLKTPHISKRHAEIEVSEASLVIKDLGSRNGTSVNGKRIKNHLLQSGDKVLFHNVLADIVNLRPLDTKGSSSEVSNFSRLPLQKEGGVNESYLETHYSNHKLNNEVSDKVSDEVNHGMDEEEHLKSGEENHSISNESKKENKGFLARYIDRGLMLGLYQLMGWMGFKGVLGLIIGVFIFTFVFLSFIPVIHVFESKAMEESKRRVLTIARTLAQVNRKAILNNLESTASVDIAERETGVLKALIVSSKEGFIISPSFQASRYPKIPFLHSERKKDTETVKIIGDNQVVAFVPILDYNPELNIQTPKAHAVVLYSLKSIAVEKERFLSFFIQTLFIAFLLGGGLFYILYKLTQHPIDKVNEQIDKALKEEGHNIQFPYLYPPMEKLVSNMNSALSRIVYNEDHKDNDFDALQNDGQDRSKEMKDLVQLVGFAAATILVPENKFGAFNEEFGEKLGFGSLELDSSSVEEIKDQAFQSNLLGLLEKVKMNPHQSAVDEIEFSGVNYEVVAQPLLVGVKGIAYVLVVLLPINEMAESKIGESEMSEDHEVNYLGEGESEEESA